MYNVSSKFLAAAASASQREVLLVQVWYGTDFLYTITKWVTGGSVSVTETAEFRRSITVTLQSQGSTYDPLVPVTQTDLLHPASGHELRVFRGFEYSTGTVEVAPLGIFRFDTVKVVDNDKSIAISVHGADRASKIARLAFTDPYNIAQGTPLTTAVKSLLLSRTSGLSLVLTEAMTPLTPTVPWRVPNTSFYSTMVNTTGTDPWQAAQQLASADGMELFFDTTGRVVMRPIQTPATLPVLITFSEGSTSVITRQISRNLSSTSEYSGVIAVGSGSTWNWYNTTPPIVPVRAEIWTATPDSPTYYLGPWGKVPYFFKTHLVPGHNQAQAAAQAQITAIARAQFLLAVRAMDAPTFTIVPNCALQEGDCVELVRKRLALKGNYVISGMTIPLMPGTAMNVKLRGPRRQVVYS